MKIIVFLLLLLLFVLSPQIISAQFNQENNLNQTRTIIPPALASERSTGGNFYQNQALSAETAFGLTILGIVFLATGLAILKVESFGEHIERLASRKQYDYARQI